MLPRPMTSMESDALGWTAAGDQHAGKLGKIAQDHVVERTATRCDLAGSPRRVGLNLAMTVFFSNWPNYHAFPRIETKGRARACVNSPSLTCDGLLQPGDQRRSLRAHHVVRA
jgi:hypothetical protein